MAKWLNVYGKPEVLWFVREWAREAALDGWDLKESYQGESVQFSGTMQKDGFMVRYIAREGDQEKGLNCHAAISAWGPDGLTIEVPLKYDFDKIKENVKKCGWCEQMVDKTVRLSFAGRACAPCREKHKATVEKEGWDN